MIISLRGTNGSGKSTVIFTMLDQYKACPIYGALGPRLPEAYELWLPKCEKPTYVLGPYLTVCGGCDRLIPYDLILTLLVKYAKRGHVVFEGVIVGSVYGRVGRLLESWKKEAVIVWLDTSLEECIRRVEERRGERGDSRPFNPKNLTYKYNQILATVKKVTEDDILRSVTISSDDALKAILKLLQGSRWSAVTAPAL